MSATCGKCGKSWGGLRAEHCTVCHETFSGTTAGDRHRVGAYNTLILPAGRRCLSAAEMQGVGMSRNHLGVWTNGGRFPSESERARWAS